MTNLDPKHLDALVGWLKSPWANASPESERGPIPEWIYSLIYEAADTITALRQQIAAMEASHAQQIAAAEAAATERAAGKATSFLVGDPKNGVPFRNPMAHEISAAIRAQITPEAASALEAREAAADRAGYLRGLREAAAVKKEPQYGDDWLGMSCAILALASRAEKGGA